MTLSIIAAAVGVVANIYIADDYGVATNAYTKHVVSNDVVVVEVVTNTYHPTKAQPTWYQPMVYDCDLIYRPDTGPDPDVRYVEVRELRHVEFDFEGKRYSVGISDKLLSKVKETRKVEMKEEWTRGEPEKIYDGTETWTNMSSVISNAITIMIETNMILRIDTNMIRRMGYE